MEEVKAVPTSSLGLQGRSQSLPRCVLIRSKPLRQQLVKSAVKLLEKDWEMAIPICSRCTEPIS